jgi:hypothetical protein
VRPIPSASALRKAQAAAAARLLDGYATFETSSTALAQVLTRSLADVELLGMRRGEHRFTAAGTELLRISA